MPATAATGMPQPAPDASDDPLDDIPLSERLSSITKMSKQQITECLMRKQQIANVVPGALSAGSNEAVGAGTEIDMQPTHKHFVVISDDDECDKSSGEEREVNAMHVKSHMLGTKTSRTGNEDIQLVDARNDAQDSQVLEKVAVQRNDANSVEISDDGLDEEASKEDMVFDEATSKQDGLETMHMHLKSPNMEATCSILQEPNEEKQLVGERNDEQDNLMMTEVAVPNSRDCELGSVPSNITLRQEQESDVLTHSVTLKTGDGLLEGPTQEMHTCIVIGEIDNTDKVSKEKNGIMDYSEKANEDILVSNEHLESPTEDSTGANRKRSGDSEKFSSRMLDGNTELVSEVCTKTLYYLSRFDRVRDAWDKDANSTGTDQDVYLPRRAVGTMEMIKRASAIRQAKIAELKKKDL